MAIGVSISITIHDLLNEFQMRRDINYDFRFMH